MKNIFRHLAAMAIIVCFAFALPEGNSKKINVVIDAGHGGKDYGSKYEGHIEKDIVKAIAEKVQALNKDADVVIHLTRNGDEFKDLDERVEAINTLNPDLVLSLHVNYAKSSDNSGMEFFIAKEAANKVQSAEYAEKLADKMKNRYGNIPVKEAPFYILRNSKVPAITLEMGYLSNEKDRGYLTTEKGQQEMAGLITDFLKEIN